MKAKQETARNNPKKQATPQETTKKSVSKPVKAQQATEKAVAADIIGYTLLTSDIKAGSIKIPQEILALLSSRKKQLKIATFSNQTLTLEINRADSRLSGLSGWFRENRLEPYNVIYFEQVDRAKADFRVFTKWESRVGNLVNKTDGLTWEESAGELAKSSIGFLELIFLVLRKELTPMSPEEIAAKISLVRKVSPGTIETTLVRLKDLYFRQLDDGWFLTDTSGLPQLKKKAISRVTNKGVKNLSLPRNKIAKIAKPARIKKSKSIPAQAIEKSIPEPTEQPTQAELKKSESKETKRPAPAKTAAAKKPVKSPIAGKKRSFAKDKPGETALVGSNKPSMKPEKKTAVKPQPAKTALIQAGKQPKPDLRPKPAKKAPLPNAANQKSDQEEEGEYWELTVTHMFVALTIIVILSWYYIR